MGMRALYCNRRCADRETLLRMNAIAYHGLLVLDKPGGMTSRAVVDRVQCWFPRGTKIGHTGTLDPLATGVLVLCIGQATRLAEYVQQMSKTYRAGILLGCTSDTDDADGTITATEKATAPACAAVEECLSGFVGAILQTPPAYSAAKLSGRRAYALARRGHDVDLQARHVRISQVALLGYEYPRLQVEVQCGKGTYIRSLARDFGERLGCGGLIETLRRTAVGTFYVTDALSLDSDTAHARASLLPTSAAVQHLPQVTLDAASLERLRRGAPVSAQEVTSSESEEVAVCDAAGQLNVIGGIDRRSGLLHPEKVLMV
jgi:tRNA pseudouridine55 synthase